MSEDWRRAGRYVRTARTRAGHKTLADFAKATGLGYSTLADLEKGRRANFSNIVTDAVEAELDLLPGELLHIAQGGRPRRHTYPDDLREVIRAWPQLTPRARAAVLQLARSLRHP